MSVPTVQSHDVISTLRASSKELRRAFFFYVTCLALCLYSQAQQSQPRDASWVVDGTVNAMAVNGSTTYIGGTFSYVGPNVPYGSAISPSTGSPNMDYVEPNGMVNAVVADGSGGWYIGGAFTYIGGTARNYLAHINADGSLDNSWNPNANGTVHALFLSGATLYVGGNFSSIGGTTRKGLASIGTDGTLASWDPEVLASAGATGTVNAIAVDGTTVYIGGSFTTVKGATRNNLAAIGTNGTLSTSWNPNAGSTVNAIGISGSIVYVGGSFTLMGGSATRNRLAAIHTNGTLQSWNPNANGVVYALRLISSTLYVGGAFTTIGSTTRNRLAAIGTNGTLDSWDPNANGTVRSLAISGTTVYMGGEFTTIGSSNTSRNRLASIGTDGTLSSWNPDASGRVNALAVSTDYVYAGGDFISIGGARRTNLAAIVSDGTILSWAPVPNGTTIYTLAISGSTLYVGGDFTTFELTGRNRLAAFNLSALSNTPGSWNPDAGAAVRTLVVSGSTVYAGGDFTTMGGTTRNRLAAIGTDGTLQSWDPNAGAAVKTIAISGSTVYVGGDFTTMGGTDRNRLAAIGTDGSLQDWNPNASGTVNAIGVSGSAVYVGGTFTTMGGTNRTRLAAIGTDGSLQAWNPIAGSTVNTIGVSGSTVYIGGSFMSIGGTVRNRLAAISTGGSLLSWDPNANNAVNALTFSGSMMYVGGTFTTIGNKARSRYTEFEVCVNPGSGGTIAAAQSGFTPFDPAAFTSSTAPSGHQGTLEYKWQSSTTSSSAGFSDIASSNSATYDPGSLTQTTWFKRLARADCSSDWSEAAQSNVLEVTVSPMAAEPTSVPTNLYFTTTGSGPYNFVGNFTASASATGYLVVRNTGSAPTFVPADETSYSSGSQTGGEIVYVGALTTFTESSVTNDINYHYAVYPFNGSGSTTNYLTTSPLTGVASARVSGSVGLSASSSASTLGFPSYGVTVNFPSGNSATSISVSQTASVPASNIQVNSSIRGMKPLYFSIMSTAEFPGTYTLVLDFSSLGTLTPTEWNNFRVTKRANASSPWMDVTTLGATIVSRQTDGVWGKFTISGLTSFSDFGMAEAYGGVLVSNLDQPSSTGLTVSTTGFRGQSFVTDAIRYDLSKLKVSVNANPSNLRARLHTSTSGGNVNTTAEISFGNPSQVGSSSVWELTPLTPFKLEPNTQYWVVFYSASGTVDIRNTSNLTETGPAAFPSNLSSSSGDGGTTYILQSGDPALYSIEATEVTRTWTGGSSTVWSAAGNWTPAESPGNGELMTIPNVANDPVLDQDIAPANLVVETGALFTMADKHITLTQGLRNEGILSATTGKLILAGSASQGITGSGTIANLELNNPAGAVISSGTGNMQRITGTLTPTSGTLTTNGNLTLRSSASGSARVASHGSSTGNVLGNVVVERYIPSTGSRKKQWRMLGFPYSSAITPGDVSGIGISYSGAQTMMLFNETSDNGVYGTSGRNGGYAPLGSATASIPAGRGVATWIYGDNAATPATGTLTADLTISSQGPLNESGASVTMSGLTNNVQGWHLIGNPFASTIDWNTVLTASTNVASTLYRWDPQMEGWTLYNQSGGSTGASASPHIESGSGFFIKAAAAGTMTLVIPQSAKVTNAPNLHFTKVPFRMDIPGERIGAASTLAGLRLKASGMGNPIPAEAYLDVSKVDATKGWDPKYDGWMMSRSAGANIYFDGAEDDDFSMQFDAPLTTGEQRYYPLTVTTPAAGQTTIEINSEGRWSNMHSVALFDQKAGKTILMQGGTLSYKFKLEELKSEGRFLLAINHVKLDADGKLPGFEVKALGNPVTGNTIDLLLTHPTASAKRWRVVDAMGREAGVGVFATDAGVQHRLTVSGMRNLGVYVLQVEMDNGETQQLRILKQ